MIQLYIDESGTMNCSNSNKFIISIVRVLDEKSLKRRFKRFINDNLQDLQKNDKNQKMFKNGKFVELKGCSLTSQLKRKLVDYLIKKQDFELYIIEIDNKKIDSKLYKDRSRAFNYMLKLSFEHFINQKFFAKKETYNIIIDERNVKVQAKRSLEDYMNTALQLDEQITEEIKVEYHDSAHIRFIQLADFFANLYFSECVTSVYGDEIKKLKKNNILKRVFKFPLT